MDRDTSMLHMVMFGIMAYAMCDAGPCVVEPWWILAALSAMTWTYFFVEIWHGRI